jgi:hypothetical protein
LKQLLLFIFIFLACRQSPAQTDSLLKKEPIASDTILKSKDWKALFIKRDQLNPDGICRHRLIKNTGVGFGACLLTFGFLYMLPEDATSWNKDDINVNTMAEEWYDNVTSGPIWDEDGAGYNYFMHPYCGAIYYMGARGAGYKIFPSFLYSAAMSTIFWEYGIEAFAEVPSIQDLIVTPVAGSFLGEGFFKLKKNIISHDDRLFGKRWAGITTKWLIDPLNQMVDLLEGERCRNVFTASGIIIPAGQRSVYSFSLTLNIGAGTTGRY